MDREALQPCYRLVGELLLHPDDRDANVIDALVAGLADSPASVREPLHDFLRRREAWSCDEYVHTLELSPPCPLYFGAYLFDEPTSCRGAGTSGRNGYMIELVNVFRHFGFEAAGGELPDYAPQVVEFLALSLEHEERDHIGLRRRLLERYVQPALEPMRQKLEKYESPYARVVETLERALEEDLARLADVPCWEPPRTLTRRGGQKALPVIVDSGEVYR